ncbi:ClpP/crotonase-like domain-containing protein [Gorgonomyces haynaldii]|nr:ClpP/crotonase-like domain-containing protein [Gorgonomyces haynaldii]
MSVIRTQQHDWVLHVYLSRSKKLNAMSNQLFSELKTTFEKASVDPTVRVIVLSAELDSRIFTAGLDLSDVNLQSETEDPARNAYKFLQHVKELQSSISSVELCNKPVIAAVHGACIGGGVDLITACDIRLCSSDASFSVKEVDIGICADIGTLQRLPKVVGNGSWVREICLTGRFVKASEALQFGLVSQVLETKEQLHQRALQLAHEIASKAPLGTFGTKRVLNYSRDHPVQDGLDYVGVWNAAFLYSPDTMQAAQASLAKTKPVFPKL